MSMGQDWEDGETGPQLDLCFLEHVYFQKFHESKEVFATGGLSV